jgi:hypothetical protein
VLGPIDLCVLQGWQWSTLVSYNAAAKKFSKFKALTATLVRYVTLRYPVHLGKVTTWFEAPIRYHYP